jgi:hypothetical protein
MTDQDEIRGNSIYETAESGVAKPDAVERPKPKAGLMGKSVFPVRLIMGFELTFMKAEGILQGRCSRGDASVQGYRDSHLEWP